MCISDLLSAYLPAQRAPSIYCDLVYIYPRLPTSRLLFFRRLIMGNDEWEFEGWLFSKSLCKRMMVVGACTGAEIRNKKKLIFKVYIV